MSTVTISKGLIGKEDINFEAADTSPSTFSRTKAGGGTQAITKLAAAHLNLEDSGSLITATNVETALAEIAGDIDDLEIFASGGKGDDIDSAATAVVPSRHLYFDVTGITTITDITVDTGGASGRLIILQFDSALTVSDSSNLKLQGDFDTQTGDHLVLLYDGTNWHEIARSTPPGTPLHSEVLVLEDNHELGEVRTLGGGHEFYSQGQPMNGFIGGQTDFGF